METIKFDFENASAEVDAILQSLNNGEIKVGETREKIHRAKELTDSIRLYLRETNEQCKAEMPDAKVNPE